MNFSQRLRDLRARESYTQQELADKANIARSTLAMYEQGHRKPDFEILDTLAEFFDVSFDYLLGRSDINTGYPEHNRQRLERLSTYQEKLYDAYQHASPDTQAAVRAILHLDG